MSPTASASWMPAGLSSSAPPRSCARTQSRTRSAASSLSRQALDTSHEYGANQAHIAIGSRYIQVKYRALG